MSKRSRRKPPKNAIVLEDLVFKLGVREVKGIIHGQQGMAVFICVAERMAEPLPFSPPIEAYETEVSTYIRTYDKSIVLELGCDDVPLHMLNERRGEIDITDPNQLNSLCEEQKLRVIPQVFSAIYATLEMAVIALVLFFTKLPFFPFTVVPACISLWCFVWFLSNYRHLSRSVVYDSVGNWIDLETGKTSLNQGTFRYRMEHRK